eukprot:2747333-Pyramimonas_sp.AAC.1
MVARSTLWSPIGTACQSKSETTAAFKRRCAILPKALVASKYCLQKDLFSRCALQAKIDETNMGVSLLLPG